MTIRVVYTSEPSFPATDQHQNAVRYQIGALWVDAVGAAPTQADVDAFFAPSADDVRKTAFKADPNYQTMLAQLKSATPAQVSTYITNNVTDLASARAMLIKLALIVAVLANGNS
jgi:hypothetical protein